jgi:hypothetical protein
MPILDFPYRTPLKVDANGNIYFDSIKVLYDWFKNITELTNILESRLEDETPAIIQNESDKAVELIPLSQPTETFIEKIDLLQNNESVSHEVVSIQVPETVNNEIVSIHQELEELRGLVDLIPTVQTFDSSLIRCSLGVSAAYGTPVSSAPTMPDGDMVFAYNTDTSKMTIFVRRGAAYHYFEQTGAI